MPKHIRRITQAKKDRRALQKLKSTGLYKGKVDGRRKPSKYQLGLINKYRDVVSGKSAILKPKNPDSYKNIFRVVGDKVIVPRRKGEKIKVTKTGAIVGERKVGGRTVKTRYRRVKRGAEIPSAKKNTMYALPFIRGRKPNGDPQLEWKRFPNLAVLKQFMEGYDYKNWTDYVVEEDIAASDEALFNKLGGKVKKIRFRNDPARRSKKRKVNKTGRNK